MAPSFWTWAGQPQRRETSRSVAEMRSSPDRASARTFERIGIEFFRSTIPCTRWSSRTRSFLRTVISMRFYLLLSRNLPTDEKEEREDVDVAETALSAGAGPAWAVGVRVEAFAAARAELWMRGDASVVLGRPPRAVVENSCKFIERLGRSC